MRLPFARAMHSAFYAYMWFQFSLTAKAIGPFQHKLLSTKVNSTPILEATFPNKFSKRSCPHYTSLLIFQHMLIYCNQSIAISKHNVTIKWQDDTNTLFQLLQHQVSLSRQHMSRHISLLLFMGLAYLVVYTLKTLWVVYLKTITFVTAALCACASSSLVFLCCDFGACSWTFCLTCLSFSLFTNSSLCIVFFCREIQIQLGLTWMLILVSVILC